jgi:hypothetical protein
MKNYLLMALLLAGCGSGSSDFTTNTVPDQEPLPALSRARGGAATDPVTLAGLPKALDPALLNGAISPKASPGDFSPVLDQGYLESCGAFGLAYETCGYEIRKAAGLSTAPSDCISPAFMYRKVLDLEHTTAANDANGTYAKDYFNFLVHHPSVNLATQGYPPVTSSDRMAAAIDGLQLAQLRSDSRLRIGSWSTLLQSSDPAAIKAQIDAGHVVGVLMQLPANFDNFYHNTGIFRGRGINRGGHFMSVVDYDDTRGAFRVQNSWGTEFGDQGFMWWDYATFLSHLSEAYVVEPVAEAGPSSSGGTLSGGATSARVVSLHQAQQASTGKVYLIFRLHLGDSLSLDSYTVVTPSGARITHNYHGHALTSGRLFLSRSDQHQWPSGRYSITLRGRDADENAVELTGSGLLSPISGIPAGDPLEVKGSDEQAAQIGN